MSTVIAQDYPSPKELTPEQEAERARAAARLLNAQARQERDKARLENQRAERARKERREAEARGDKSAPDVVEAYEIMAAAPHIGSEQVVALLCVIGASAAKAGDLGVARQVAADLLKHAKEAEHVDPKDAATIEAAVARMGPAAVERTAARVGLTVQPKSEAQNQFMRAINSGAVPHTRALDSLQPTD